MPLPPFPRVGIVMPTADPSKPLPAKAIERARRTTSHLGAQLEVVASSGPDFRFSRSINRGVAALPDRDAWVLLNDDAIMDEGWLDAMLEAARAHPRAGLVGAPLRFEDGRLQHAGGYIPLTPLEFLVAGLRHKAPLWALRGVRDARFAHKPYMYAHWHTLDASHRLDFLTAACVLVTRECWEAAGPYDEAYLFGHEDIDYSLRALEAGFELCLAWRATGVHLEGASGRGLSARQQESDRVFRERWDALRIRRATRGRRGIHHR